MKIEMNLLNPDRLSQIKGGASCTKTGDTIICGGKHKIIVCVTGEASCEQNFSSSCNVFGVTIGCEEFTIKPQL